MECELAIFIIHLPLFLTICIAINTDSIRLPSIEYPSSARVMNVNNDALGRTRSIDTFVSGIKYFANGVLSDMEYSNGSIFNSSLNDKYLPEMVRTLNGSTTIVNLNYSYDLDNNVTAITDFRDSTNSRTMDYDGLGRMITANGRWGAGNISYNDNHDIETLNLGSSNIAYHYHAGKLTSTNGSINKNFSYDKYGNVSANGKDSFVYDDANQMLKVSNQNIDYTYDGNKKRVKVKTPSKTVYYFYNLAGELLYRYDKTNKKDIEYINLNGKLIAKLEQKKGTARKHTYYHYDLLGSPVANTNQAGNIVWREEYSPWGEKLLKEDADHDNVRDYTGHVHDKETGLTYMQARYYDPQIGRFMGIDPVGFKEDNPIMFNRYAYANNNPFKFVDPNGELPFCSFCGVNQYERAITTADVLADNLPLIGNAKSAYEVKTGTNPITGEEIPDSMRVLGAVSMVAPWIKNSKHAKKLPLSSNDARKKVMNEQGIPLSQKPISQSQNASGREYQYKVPKPGGGLQIKSVQQQTLDRSHPNQGHWEAGTVKTDPITGDVRTNNYGRAKLENDKSKADYEIDNDNL